MKKKKTNTREGRKSYISGFLGHVSLRKERDTRYFLHNAGEMERLNQRVLEACKLKKRRDTRYFLQVKNRILEEWKDLISLFGGVSLRGEVTRLLGHSLVTSHRSNKRVPEQEVVKVISASSSAKCWFKKGRDTHP